MVSERSLSFNDLEKVITIYQRYSLLDAFYSCSDVKKFNIDLVTYPKTCERWEMISIVKSLQAQILDIACDKYFRDVTTEDFQRMTFEDICADCFDTQVTLKELKERFKRNEQLR